MAARAEAPFEDYLVHEQAKGLLRFLTCGSVDDGKSTLIGRLLYDSRNVFEDQIHAATKATRNRSAGSLDLSLLTDGLRAEREQGITIDVAYRYFATARRKFIIADTPGHEQYTRNMATGASTADLAIILIDASAGVLPQSRRHAYICSLLGISKFVVAVNKMDLVGYDRAVFDRIRREFGEFLAGLGVHDAYFVPMSALAGDQVVTSNGNMTWFHGPSLLEHLETVELADPRGTGAFRMAVQRVCRPDREFRGYAGQVASGTIHPGDMVTVLPSGRRSRVKRIVTFDGDLQEAFAPMAVTLELEDHLDISRGDLLFAGAAAPHRANRFEAQIVWMDGRALDPRRRYLVKHTSQTVPAEVAVRHRVDIETMKEQPAVTLEMNGIGVVEISTAKPLFFDAYRRNRATGSLILIDAETNLTVAAAMILRPVTTEERLGPVTAEDRSERWRHRGAVVRVADGGVAEEIERALFDRGCAVARADTEGEAAVLERAGMLAILVMSGAPDGDVSGIVERLEREKVLL
jgi:sulfate adenylyltransferase subunit 1